MFLEFCGKLCFSQIRPAFFYSFLLLPFVIAGSYLLSRHTVQQQLEVSFADAASKGKKAIERKTRKERFIQRYSNSDPFFLDNRIESLLFLQKELSAIQAMIDHPALSNKGILQERKAFLESETNRLAFTEENIRSTSKIKETEEKQRRPVQLDEQDLQRLLSSIEDISVGQYDPIPKMPQLLIREMKIKKIENPFHSEVYEVEMELLKREWISP